MNGKIKLVLFLLVLSAAAWAQSDKYAWTTRYFLDEQRRLSEQTAQAQQAPARGGRNSVADQPERVVAEPDTIDGVAYISCFVHLQDPSDLSAVQAMGVRVESTFDGLDFITARVPVAQLEALAEVENVTLISVGQLMQQMTDVAREQTGTNYLLSNTSAAQERGLAMAYDGTGVVLGIIDTGIDFGHIAFKDKNGHSRIKRAYVYDGTGSAKFYNENTVVNATTDDVTQDHGTHTASTAGGSSVIINGQTITVTDNHAEATYGGMAPGADLYLAGIKGLNDIEIANALHKIVAYADTVGLPLVLSNSWGSIGGPCDGSGELSALMSSYFGTSHPNRVVLFAAGNYAGVATGKSEPGGFAVRKVASQASPLGSIIRSTRYGNTDGGFSYYPTYLSFVWSSAPTSLRVLVLDNTTGAVLHTEEVTKDTTFTDISDQTTTYYKGKLKVYSHSQNNKYGKRVIVQDSLRSMSFEKVDNIYHSQYVLALEVFPAEGEADIWLTAGKYNYFSDYLTTEGHSWMRGTDDLCVSDEACFPDVIPVGAYVSRNAWTNVRGEHYSDGATVQDIAYFSSYGTAAMTPLGVDYPWITAPGSKLAAGVNHLHTTSVDANSYYGENLAPYLMFGSTENPYALMQGTSMSTPTAAGIVALWLQAAQSVQKSLDLHQIKDIMCRTAKQDYYTIAGESASHFGQGKIDALAGIRYIVGETLDLEDNACNSVKISKNNGETTNVMLYGRTLYKDGDWNTLCLPFDVTLAGSPLEGVEARELSYASLVEGTLTLNFSSPVTTLEAGKPYIIKWAEGTNLVSPVFPNVTLNATLTEKAFSGVSFLGTYDPIAFDATTPDILMVGGNNRLYYPAPGASVKSCRAYFRLTDVTQAPSRIVFQMEGENTATGIEGTEQLESKKFRKNGHIYIQRNGVTYDVLGRRVRK